VTTEPLALTSCRAPHFTLGITCIAKLAISRASYHLKPDDVVSELTPEHAVPAAQHVPRHADRGERPHCKAHPKSIINRTMR
jgi:hypothetical protein